MYRLEIANWNFRHYKKSKCWRKVCLLISKIKGSFRGFVFIIFCITCFTIHITCKVVCVCAHVCVVWKVFFYFSFSTIRLVTNYVQKQVFENMIKHLTDIATYKCWSLIMSVFHQCSLFFKMPGLALGLI